MSILEKQISRAKKANQPLFCSLELTHLCNYVCKHCYNFDRSRPTISSDQSLSTTEVKNLLKDLKLLGVLSINLTGGEPLLRKDIFEIIHECSLLNFQTRLKSNGFLLSKETALELSSKGLKEVDISLYGSNETTYLNFCGREGFEKTISGIQNAKEAGLIVNVSIILHKENFRQLDAMIKVMKELGVNYYISDEITDRYDKTLARDSLGLDQKSYEELLESEHSFYFDHDNTERNLMCGCAKTVLGIGCLGQVYPCIGAPIEAGNIRKDSISKIWKDSPVLNEIRNYSNLDFKSCQSCSVIQYCSRSSGSAFVNVGEYTGCDPVAFEHAKAREAKFKKN